MEQTKKQKTIRIVSLIALTILVIVGVVLTIYFVQKADTIIVGEIGKEIENKDYTIKVTNFVCDNTDQETGFTKATITIEMKAKKNIKVNLSKFALGDYTLLSADGFKESLKKGDISQFELNYVVKVDQKLLYIIYNNIKIALGEAY